MSTKMITDGESIGRPSDWTDEDEQNSYLTDEDEHTSYLTRREIEEYMEGFTARTKTDRDTMELYAIYYLSEMGVPAWILRIKHTFTFRDGEKSISFTSMILRRRQYSSGFTICDEIAMKADPDLSGPPVHDTDEEIEEGEEEHAG